MRMAEVTTNHRSRIVENKRFPCSVDKGGKREYNNNRLWSFLLLVFCLANFQRDADDNLLDILRSSAAVPKGLHYRHRCYTVLWRKMVFKMVTEKITFFENNPLHTEFVSDFASVRRDKGEEEISNVSGEFLKTYNPYIVVSRA